MLRLKSSVVSVAFLFAVSVGDIFLKQDIVTINREHEPREIAITPQKLQVYKVTIHARSHAVEQHAARREIMVAVQTLRGEQQYGRLQQYCKYTLRNDRSARNQCVGHRQQRIRNR